MHTIVYVYGMSVCNALCPTYNIQQLSANLTLPAGEYVILHLVFLQPKRFWRKSIFSSYLAPPAQRTPVAAADWSAAGCRV